MSNAVKIYDTPPDVRPALYAVGRPTAVPAVTADAAPAVTTDAVRDYLQQIGHYPVLTAEEESSLARGIEVGLLAQERLDSGLETDPADVRALRTLVDRGRVAHQRFIYCNLKLVVSIAKRYNGCGVPLLDLIQEGNVGLDRAVKKFDYSRGLKFSTYATWWIRQAISRSIADGGSMIRVPVHVAERINKLTRISRDLAIVHGREATIREIADEAKVPCEEVESLLELDRDGVSLQFPIGEDALELGDLIEDSDLSPVADIVAIRVRNDELHRRVSSLPTREAKVLQFRFGLGGSVTMTFEQVGNILGVSRERVRQLETRALKLLRCPELEALLD